jgi:hypothetical protein
MRIDMSVAKWKKSKTKVFYCNRGCAHEPRVEKLLKHKPGNYREDIEMSVRSSWEANLIRIFQYKNIPFTYEPTLVPLYHGDVRMFYLPDFIVNHKVIEVKGAMERTYKTKMFEKQYRVRVRVVDEKVYGWLYKRYSRKIEHWERSKEFERLLTYGLL